MKKYLPGAILVALILPALTYSSYAIALRQQTTTSPATAEAKRTAERSRPMRSNGTRARRGWRSQSYRETLRKRAFRSSSG